MSKIGKQPVKIPEGVEAKIEDGGIFFKSASGEMRVDIMPKVKALIENGVLSFNVESKDKISRMNWGTMRSLAANAAEGLSKGFEKKLEIEGIGYSAEKRGNDVLFRLGFSHPVEFKIPDGIKAEVEKNRIKISGFDKQLVGEVAAEIRALRKAEPYKGKGIRYQGETIRRKVGKKAAGATGGAAVKA